MPLPHSGRRLAFFLTRTRSTRAMAICRQSNAPLPQGDSRRECPTASLCRDGAGALRYSRGPWAPYLDRPRIYSTAPGRTADVSELALAPSRIDAVLFE